MTIRAFDDIIDINEHIKTINTLSKQVKLEAVNASLSARVVGEKGKGFVVVAQELHHFSELLNRAKNEQLELNQSIIMLTTQRMALDVRASRLQQAIAAHAERRCVEGIEEQLKQAQRNINQKILEQQRKMGSLVETMLEYCNVGSAISNTALIEAAHCGPAGTSLRQVAKIMGTAVYDITNLLNNIRKINALRYQHTARELS